MDTYIYKFEDNLYINLTNRCSNDCIFCLRNSFDGVGGSNLWLSREPDAADIISILEATELSSYRQVVFCGYGEPTYRINEIVKVGGYLKQRGAYVRLDTNGQGNLINNRDIVPELAGAVDFVSVSLNNSSSEEYMAACKPEFGQDAYFALIEFAVSCKKAGIAVQFSIVDTIPADEIERCKRISADYKVPLRIRNDLTGIR